MTVWSGEPETTPFPSGGHKKKKGKSEQKSQPKCDKNNYSAGGRGGTRMEDNRNEWDSKDSSYRSEHPPKIRNGSHLLGHEFNEDMIGGKNGVCEWRRAVFCRCRSIQNKND